MSKVTYRLVGEVKRWRGELAAMKYLQSKYPQNFKIELHHNFNYVTYSLYELKFSVYPRERKKCWSKIYSVHLHLKTMYNKHYWLCDTCNRFGHQRPLKEYNGSIYCEHMSGYDKGQNI